MVGVSKETEVVLRESEEGFREYSHVKNGRQQGRKDREKFLSREISR